MKRRRIVGNYLKKYPHVYGVFQKEIKRKNIYNGIAWCLIGIFAGFFLVFLLMDYKDGYAFFGILTAINFIIFQVFAGTSGTIDEEELALMDKDFAGRVEKVEGLGYRTEEALIVGFYRIPFKGLLCVTYDRVPVGRRGNTRIELDCCYEGGKHLRAECLKKPEEGEDEKLTYFIRKYHDDIKVQKGKVQKGKVQKSI